MYLMPRINLGLGLPVVKNILAMKCKLVASFEGVLCVEPSQQMPAKE
jgi:hypothetical protein